MVKILSLIALELMLGLASGRAQISASDPLLGLERLKNFEVRRASSADPNWRNGNRDARPIPPGETLVLADLEGPGVISHLWCTVLHPDPFYARLLTLRIHWDGEQHPSVECPLGDFFGVGHGAEQPVVSLPITVTAEGRARNCYWPMPFRKSARVTVTNESDKRCMSFYYYVDWQKHAALPEDSAYFHAMYRQEFPALMGQNYLLADIRGRGHYVGTVQSVYHSSPGWYGEGDDCFFIDGAAEPQLRGTGTEDYFCDAWGFRQQNGPFYGTPLWEGRKAGDSGTSYRFHLTDPVTFRQGLRVEIEHKGTQDFPDGTFTGFIERDDLISSVAFWYQMEPHQPWPALPPGPRRLNYAGQSVLVTGGAAVTRARQSAAPPTVQDFRLAANGKMLVYPLAQASGWLDLAFDCPQAQTVDLFGKFVCDRDRGVYRVFLDGAEIGTVDLYFFRDKLTEFKWGRHELTAGAHTLRFECAGKNSASRGYSLGFDQLIARTPVYLRPAGFDLRSPPKSR